MKAATQPLTVGLNYLNFSSLTEFFRNLPKCERSWKSIWEICIDRYIFGYYWFCWKIIYI